MISFSWIETVPKSVRRFDNRLIDAGLGGRIQRGCGNYIEVSRGGFWTREDGRSEALKVGEEGLPDFAAEGEAGEFAFALDVDEAGGFQLFEMVGECGGGDGEAFAHVAAGPTVLGGAELFDDFEPAGVG
jgi:hypothetical protein